jgi:hypothetical protein
VVELFLTESEASASSSFVYCELPLSCLVTLSAVSPMSSVQIPTDPPATD